MSTKMKSLAGVLAALMTFGPALALASSHSTPELRRTQTNVNKGKKSKSPLLGIPVTGSNGFSGTLDIVSFRALPGVEGTDPFEGHVHSGTYTPQVAAIGVVTGVVPTASGPQLVSRFVEIPVTYVGTPPGACDILNLVLGPLDLNILGLVIQLNQVELDIFAVPGAGNLLGNLLCAVAGLLDGAGAIANFLALLNAITDFLNGIFG